MPNTVLQHRRGTTAEHASFTGAAGEFTMDTTKKTVVVHDGTTAGGIAMAREDRTITVGAGLKIGDDATSSTLAENFTINIDAENITSALVATEATNEVIRRDANGKLTAALDLAYNTSTGKFDLTNGDGDIIATVTVPSSTSMLQSAELVVDPQGQPAGTYLKMTLLLADGSTTDIYTNVSDLIDVYTGGNGITISNNEVAVDLAASGNMAYVDASGKLIVPTDLGTLS